jgi:hypothetical protein
MALALMDFFLLQRGLILLELWLDVARWHPALAHPWTVIVMIGCSLLCIEPILRTALDQRPLHGG